MLKPQLLLGPAQKQAPMFGGLLSDPRCPDTRADATPLVDPAQSSGGQQASQQSSAGTARTRNHDSAGLRSQSRTQAAVLTRAVCPVPPCRAANAKTAVAFVTPADVSAPGTRACSAQCSSKEPERALQGEMSPGPYSLRMPLLPWPQVIRMTARAARVCQTWIACCRRLSRPCSNS